MPRIAYVNGRYTPHADASVHVEDRGYQFADGVYEVCEVARGNIMDMTRHLDRLDRSLRELRIEWPIARRALDASSASAELPFVEALLQHEDRAIRVAALNVCAHLTSVPRAPVEASLDAFTDVSRASSPSSTSKPRRPS